MDHADYVAALNDELDRFIANLPGAEPTVPIRTCPGWQATDLIGHVGSTFQWVVANIEKGGDRVSYRPFFAEIPKDPAELLPWVGGCVEALRQTFREVDPDRPCWSWAADQRAGFWSRRMLHELSIHHADLLLSLDREVPVAEPTAIDGVDEFLSILRYARWVPTVAELTGDGERIGVLATDADAAWQVTLTPDGIEAQRAEDVSDASVVVSGPVARLYLFCWGRILAPAVQGDEALLTRWTAGTAI